MTITNCDLNALHRIKMYWGGLIAILDICTVWIQSQLTAHVCPCSVKFEFTQSEKLGFGHRIIADMLDSDVIITWLSCKSVTWVSEYLLNVSMSTALLASPRKGMFPEIDTLWLVGFEYKVNCWPARRRSEAVAGGDTFVRCTFSIWNNCLPSHLGFCWFLSWSRAGIVFLIMLITKKRVDYGCLEDVTHKDSVFVRKCWSKRYK